MSKGKNGFRSKFEITDQESCEKAIRNGGVAALLSAGITTVFGFVAFFTQSSNETINYFLDPFLLLDAGFILVLAVFIFRKSRVASTLLLIYFVTSKAIIWSDLGEPKGFAMSFFFFLFYVNAMRGTYLWHSKYRESHILETI